MLIPNVQTCKNIPLSGSQYRGRDPFEGQQISKKFANIEINKRPCLRYEFCLTVVLLLPEQVIRGRRGEVGRDGCGDVRLTWQRAQRVVD